MDGTKRLIDANALLQKLHRMIDYCKANNKVTGLTALFQVGDAIMDCKTVDAVEVVHGRWETANDGTHFCTHCGCDAPYTWDDIDRNFINSTDDVPDQPSNYCPNCGAKMDGERKDNDN